MGSKVDKSACDLVRVAYECLEQAIRIGEVYLKTHESQ